MGGVAQISATIAEPGVIRQTGTFMRLVFGELDGRPQPARRRLPCAVPEAGFDARAVNADPDRALGEVRPARHQQLASWR